MNVLLTVAALLADPAPVWNWHDRIAWGVNIILAAIGIIGVIVAISTLRKIERQTRATEQAAIATEKSAKATEVAADATLKQTNHMVASERPFLMIQAVGFEYIEFKAVNRGNSPAQIIFYNNFPNLDTPLVRAEQKWNPPPAYGFGYDIEGAEIINVQWLAPGDQMVVGTYTLSSLKEVDPDLWDAVEKLTRLMYLWSSVKYRGLSAPTIYESRYCYRVTSNGPIMAGPPGLNSYS
jgi:hypothetical protein